MTIDIASLIPHAGRMVLLDTLIAHDAGQIQCRAKLDPRDHPLASQNRLPATVLAEYGAQAMAVHGGLLAEPGTAPRPGRLVALSELDLAVEFIDQPCSVEIQAECLDAGNAGQIYRFEVRHGQNCLARGRATVMFAD
jgi:predicted hotdog family 3-hydroxylacyl-ACP dehydratase